MAVTSIQKKCIEPWHFEQGEQQQQHSDAIAVCVAVSLHSMVGAC